MARRVLTRDNKPALPDLIRQKATRPADRLRDGAYQVRLRIDHERIPNEHRRYEGILRIVYEDASRLRGSGDLYWVPWGEEWTGWGDALAGAQELPVFPRDRYQGYARLLDLELGRDLELTWEVCRYGTAGWREEGVAKTAFLDVKRPGGHLAKHLEGNVVEDGVAIGKIELRWLHEMVRECFLEIGQAPGMPAPGTKVEWKRLFAAVGWRLHHRSESLTLSPSVAHSLAKSGHHWKRSLLQTLLGSFAEPSRLDEQWRYHLLSVGKYREAAFGEMFDREGADYFDYRQGAVIAAEGSCGKAIYGSFANRPQASDARLFFRNAAHEVIHTMGIKTHHSVGTDLMTGVDTLAKSLAPNFPKNVPLSYSDRTRLLLRHMPDPLTRPGGLLGDEFWKLPAGVDPPGGLALRARSLESPLPLGAPLRLALEIGNAGSEDRFVPEALSFRAGVIHGRIWTPAGDARVFSTILRDLEAGGMRLLAPGNSHRSNVTVVRGADGALMPTAGRYRVEIAVHWHDESAPRYLFASEDFEVAPPVDEPHRRVAERLLRAPRVLLGLVLRTKEPEIASALKHPVLHRHWNVVAIRRELEEGRFSKAAAAVDEATLLTGRECARIADGFLHAVDRLDEHSQELRHVVERLDRKIEVQQGLVAREDREKVNELGKALDGEGGT